MFLVNFKKLPDNLQVKFSLKLFNKKVVTRKLLFFKQNVINYFKINSRKIEKNFKLKY